MQKIGINTLYNYVAFLAGKDIAGGFIPPDRWNEMVPILVNKIARKYYGVPEEYQPGMPMPRIAYEITQLVTDYLSQLKVEKLYTVPNTGIIIKPDNYLHKSSIAVSGYKVEDSAEDEDENEVECCGNKTVQRRKKKYNSKTIYETFGPVTVVSENERWSWLKSSLRKPTLEDPIAVFLGDDQIQLYPKDIKTALLVYIRYPQTCKWNYTINAGVPVYDPVGSVDVELPDICADELAVTILDRVGITIREPGLVDWSRYIKERGT